MGGAVEPAEKIGDVVKSVTGLLLVVFIGALNVLGIKSNEFDDVLRNFVHQVVVIFVMLAVAIALSLVGAFTPARDRSTIGMAVFGGLLAADALLVVILLVPQTIHTPPIRIVSGLTETQFQVVLALIGFVSLLAILALIVRNQFGLNKPVIPTAGVFLGAAAVLTMAAIFCALRLETSSQLATSQPRISVTVTTSGDKDVIAVRMSASHLSADEYVKLDVFGLKNPTVSHFNRSVGCSTAGHQGGWIAGAGEPPDTDGEVSSTITVPVRSTLYQQYEICAWEVQTKYTVAPQPTPSPSAASSNTVTRFRSDDQVASKYVIVLISAPKATPASAVPTAPVP